MSSSDVRLVSKMSGFCPVSTPDTRAHAAFGGPDTCPAPDKSGVRCPADRKDSAAVKSVSGGLWITSEDVVVGIDPGVTTGFAVWSLSGDNLTACDSFGIVEAMARTLEERPALLVVEDARMRGGRPQASMGAGSVRRDCSIWQEWAEHHQIPVKFISPADKGAKLSAAQFQALTGWSEGLNEHARDAAAIARLGARIYRWQQRQQATGKKT